MLHGAPLWQQLLNHDAGMGQDLDHQLRVDREVRLLNARGGGVRTGGNEGNKETTRSKQTAAGIGRRLAECLPLSPSHPPPLYAPHPLLCPTPPLCDEQRHQPPLRTNCLGRDKTMAVLPLGNVMSSFRMPPDRRNASSSSCFLRAASSSAAVRGFESDSTTATGAAWLEVAATD